MRSKVQKDEDIMLEVLLYGHKNLIMNDTAYVSPFLTRMIISIFFSSVDQKFLLGLEGSIGKKQNYNSWILGILSQVGTIGARGSSCGSIQVSSKTRGGSQNALAIFI